MSAGDEEDREFAAWKDKFAHRLIGIPTITATKVQRLRVRCETCNDVFEVDACEGQLRRVVLPGPGADWAWAARTSLQRQQEAYLLSHGHVVCWSCDHIMKVEIPRGE